MDIICKVNYYFRVIKTCHRIVITRITPTKKSPYTVVTFMKIGVKVSFLIDAQPIDLNSLNGLKNCSDSDFFSGK